MLGKILRKIVGSRNERELSRLFPLVDQINALEAEMIKLPDQELRAFTPAFKERLDRGESLDDLLPEAFAVAREAGRRVLGQRHFDVQLIGGMVLHEGNIAEMRTGEGKTLAATCPVYLNALTGKGVHVVTVNDYLASRDAQWMGEIYRYLGLSTGCIVHGLTDEERKEQYGGDVTYGTNNEFGFDYLRDNMKFEVADLVQREYNFAIVDEVDSILIDEARTPLIISGPSEKSSGLYTQINRLIPSLKRNVDYTVDEKSKTANLAEEGVAHCEQLLKMDNLYDPRHIEVLHHIQQALKAHALFKRDRDYIVQKGEVIIVDEFTGRLMHGRRYSEGLHQALEAKERVRVKSENQTLATITFQNYFRMYAKLAGMTGTADTEAAEFHKIYNLEVVVIPTHMPMIRRDNADVVYRTAKEKHRAAVEEITEVYKAGQPVLVGTASIETNEMLSKMLKLRKVPHHVLNAKHHAKEAEIIAQAGRKGAVTLATNMAGRGTDIVLGGNPEFLARQEADPGDSLQGYTAALGRHEALCRKEREEVLQAGGLHILGTERHESRRIDNQLRGRSGRQGDPGSSRFYLSLEDDLMRLFGSERIKGLMGALGMEDGVPIEHGIISKAIENAQRKVEGHNFDIRKQLLEYDDVMNQQREVLYEQRRAAVTGDRVRETILEMIGDVAAELVYLHADETIPSSQWDWEALNTAVQAHFGFAAAETAEDGVNPDGLAQEIVDQAQKAYGQKLVGYGEELMLYLEQVVLLQIVDNLWKDHLLGMDHLKEGIGLRGYAQKDPLREYQREGYEMFAGMIARIKAETVSTLFHVRVEKEDDLISMAPPEDIAMDLSGGGETKTQAKSNKKNAGKKIGRNAPCPCGSGKKFKKCCGKN